MQNSKIFLNITLIVIFIFSSSVFFGQTLNSPEELKAYLDKQIANSPDKPINVTMNVNETMLKKISSTINSSGKYVNLDLSASTITKIGDVAFLDCVNLTSVTIPKSVTSIGLASFSSCANLTALSVNFGNTTFSSDDGVLYNKSKTTLVVYPGGKKGAFTIPDNVTSVEKFAFSGCSSLTSVTIPNSVKSIGDSSFIKCSNLTSVTIPNSITSIEDRVFVNCTSLANITIPNSVTRIGQEAFGGCTNLTTLIIPNSVISIGNFAFSNCLRLTSVTFQGAINYRNIIGNPFPGDLLYNYLNGGIGTYTREPLSNTWKKQ